MKKLIVLVAFLFFNIAAQAQGDGGGRVRKMRVEYLTQKLNLAPEQNAKFWSVYNRYLDERSDLRKIYKDQFNNKGNAHLGKYQANRYVDDNIEYKQKDLDLSKKYQAELLQVINAQQLANLYQAERDFKKMLIATLKDK